ncbi:MAG: hypothetical protein J7M05_09335, partial [Anaerolineae bacterium]|nr:hypothetical protein [Anaerolineae bacterium]
SLLFPFLVIAPAYRSPRLLERGALAPQVYLDATFGDGIRLLGYDLLQREAKPGGEVALKLYWECLRPLKEHYSLFIHLERPAGLIAGQRDVYPGQGTYPTSLWIPGGCFVDTYVVPISPVVPTPEELTLKVGFYRLESGERLPVRDAQGNSLGNALTLERFYLSRQVRDGIPNPVFFNLERRIALVGFQLDRTVLAPGDTLRLTLYWRALAEGRENYSVFTHLVDEQGRIWAQKDGWPQQGRAPTATWQRGQLVRDEYSLSLAKDAPEGVYQLEVGMYRASGKRLILLGPGGYAQDTRILLGPVRVIPIQE